MSHKQFENFSPSGETDREQRIVQQTARIGSFLDKLYETLPSQLGRNRTAALVHRIRTFVFRSQPQGVVWAERTDYQPPHRNEETLLRTFRIRFIPSDGAPTPEWLINEIAEGQRIKYEPRLLEYGESSCGQYENMAPSASKDPSPDEMEEAARIMEECWKLYKGGSEDALLMSTAPLPSVQGRHRAGKSAE